MDVSAEVPDWAKVAKAIKQHRQSGEVIVALLRRTPGTPDRAASDAVRSMGLRPVAWNPLTRADAVSVLTRVLHRDLAYSAPIMPNELASHLAARALSFFDDSASFFTNRSLAEGQSTGSWEPVSSATFDTGVIAVGQAYVAVIWCMDED